jgi:hypothetical protein
MMLNQNSIIGMSFCLILLSNCAHLSENTANQPEDLDSYFPLKIGNCWTYTTWYQTQAQADLKVCIQKIQDGFFIDNRPRPSRWKIDLDGIRDGSTRYVLKTPIQKGNKWMSVSDVRTVERYEILEVDKRVELPAGIFKNCVVVRMEVKHNETDSLINRMVFAPGTGIVEIRTELSKDGKLFPQSLFELKSIQLQQ